VAGKAKKEVLEKFVGKEVINLDHLRRMIWLHVSNFEVQKGRR